jgi:hypothetical protein
VQVVDDSAGVRNGVYFQVLFGEDLESGGALNYKRVVGFAAPKFEVLATFVLEELAWD